MSERPTVKDYFEDKNGYYYRLRSLDRDGHQEQENMGALGVVSNRYPILPANQLQQLRLRAGSHRLELIITEYPDSNTCDDLFEEPDGDPTENAPDLEGYNIAEELVEYKRSVVARFHVIQTPVTTRSCAWSSSAWPIPTEGQSRDDRHTILLNPAISFETGHKELLIIGYFTPTNFARPDRLKVSLRFGLDVYN